MPFAALNYFFEIIFLIFFGGLIIFLLFITIWKRHSLKISIPTGLLFLCLTFLSFFVYYKITKAKKEASKKFLHDYRLYSLDKDTCINCKIRLKEDYSYEILKNGKLIGTGDWIMKSAYDTPLDYIEIENGPPWTITETDSVIYYIDRTEK